MFTRSLFQATRLVKEMYAQLILVQVGDVSVDSLILCLLSPNHSTGVAAPPHRAYGHFLGVPLLELS